MIARNHIKVPRRKIKIWKKEAEGDGRRRKQKEGEKERRRVTNETVEESRSAGKPRKRPEMANKSIEKA